MNQIKCFEYINKLRLIYNKYGNLVVGRLTPTEKGITLKATSKPYLTYLLDSYGHPAVKCLYIGISDRPRIKIRQLVEELMKVDKNKNHIMGHHEVVKGRWEIINMKEPKVLDYNRVIFVNI